MVHDVAPPWRCNSASTVSIPSIVTINTDDLTLRELIAQGAIPEIHMEIGCSHRLKYWQGLDSSIGLRESKSKPSYLSYSSYPSHEILEY